MLLSACTSSESPQKKILLSQTTITRAQLGQIAWWEKMHDPVLNNLMKRVLKNNSQILAAQANILQAQALLKAAYNAWLPTVDGSVNGFLVKGWDSNINPQGSLTNSALGRVNNLKIDGAYAGFVPKYSLNILENINNTRLSKASLDKQKAIYMALNLSVIGQTVGAYFSFLGQKQQLIEQEQLIGNLKKLRYLEAVRYKTGASDYYTLSTIDQDIANNQATSANLQASISQVESTLQVLTGSKHQVVFKYRTIYSLNTDHLIPAHLPANVLEYRPDLMIAKENLVISDAHLGLAYARFFPQISLTGLLGGSSVELVHLLKLTTGLGIAQVAAVMPIFNGVFYQQIQAAKSEVKAEYYNYIQTLRAALADVDSSLTNYKKAKEAYEYQLKAYHASLRGYRIVLSRYKAGYQDQRSALNARITLDKAKITAIQAKTEQLNTLVLVYQALAGGVSSY